MQKKKQRTSRRGGAALAAALVLPILLTILMGFIETGWIFHGQQAVTRAVRDGCRAGAMAASPADPADTAADAIVAALDVHGFDCPDAGCEPEVTLAWTAGERFLSCSLTAPHASLTSFIPGLEGIALTSATRNRVERTED